VKTREILKASNRRKLEKLQDAARKEAKVIDVAAHQRVWYRLSSADGRRLSAWRRTERSVTSLLRDVNREDATITADDREAAKTLITLLEDVILSKK